MKERVARFVAENTEQLYKLTEDLVNIQSGTANKEGVNAVSSYLGTLLQDYGCTPRFVPRSEVGDVLIVDTPSAVTAKHPILLSGHMDTVFPIDSPFNKAWYANGNMHGPGTCDMKGGLVVAIYAMLALRAVGRDDIPLRFIFSPDEECSSLYTRDVLHEEGAKAACGLVFEMAGENHELVRTRKGKIAFGADIHGQAGHAAFITKGKISAIHDAARKVELLETLTLPPNMDSPNSLSVNVGKISGGIGVNTVPELAHLDVEARCTTIEQVYFIRETMRNILTTPSIAGTRTDLTKEVLNVPLEARSTAKLYELATKAAADLGQSMGEDFRPGCSEAAYLAATGLPVIDGLGPLGKHDHSDREYLVLSSMPERVELTTHLIMAAWGAWEQGELSRIPLAGC